LHRGSKSKNGRGTVQNQPQEFTVNAWNISTSAYVQGERPRVWQQALSRLHLPTVDQLDTYSSVDGDVVSLVSPQGIEFARMSASPQTISGRSGEQPFSVWLSILMEGRFAFGDRDGPCVDLMPGDIIYGPTGVDSTLTVKSDFRMLYVKIPQLMLHPRLVNLGSLRTGALSRRKAVNRIFAGMLTSVADNIEELDAAELRPVESALTEFVVAGLAGSTAVQAFGSTARLVHFQRICQSIEDQLGDPELTVGKVAAEQHASLRYIQKLFEAAGLSFGQYLRQRRLERCRSDLQSALHRHLSISDICFGWGFSDPAHFSRTFRAEFGTTPRAYRQAQLDRGETQPAEAPDMLA
jgi:AraC-like DNA-binding protein